MILKVRVICLITVEFIKKEIILKQQVDDFKDEKKKAISLSNF